MVPLVLRLKLVLIANAFRRTPLQVIGLVVALAYGIGTATFVGAALVALRFFDVELARSSVVVFGSLIVALFTILPLVLGMDDLLEPRRFALYGIPNTALAAGIAVASLISVPAIVITIIAIAQVSTWTRGPEPFGLAIVSAILIIATCILSARVLTSVAGLVVATRVGRDLLGVGGVLVLVGLVPVVILAATTEWGSRGLAVLHGAASVLAWTPLGAAWAAPGDSAAGDPLGAFLKLVIALVWLVVLALLWRALVGVTLVSAERLPKARRYLGLGWFARFPGRPVGAVAARSVTYWLRDPRYLANIAIIPFVPILMIAALAIAGVPMDLLVLLPVPVMCLFLSWSVHNDVAYDNTAVWLHLVSSISGKADRVGRLVPPLAIGLPLIVVGTLVSVALNGDWSLYPALLGVSVALLFVGLGLSSTLSARFPYAAVRPGDSPFSQPQALGNSSALIQGLSFFGILIVCSPVILSAILALMFGWHWPLIALGLGVVIGFTVLLLGIRSGARIFERRATDILAAALQN